MAARARSEQAKIRNLEHHPGLPYGHRDPRTQTVSHSFSTHISSELLGLEPASIRAAGVSGDSLTHYATTVAAVAL